MQPHKTLKFAPDLVPLVLAGKKTSTWRLFDDKNLAENDVLDLIDRGNLQKFATARITHLIEKPLRDITPEDTKGHEQYEDPDTLLRSFQKFYGDAATLDTPAKLITFALISE